MAGRIKSAYSTIKAVGKWAAKHPKVGALKARGSRAAASMRAGTRRVIGAKAYGATMKGKRKYITGGVLAGGAAGGAYAVKRKRSRAKRK